MCALLALLHGFLVLLTLSMAFLAFLSGIHVPSATSKRVFTVDVDVKLDSSSASLSKDPKDASTPFFNSKSSVCAKVKHEQTLGMKPLRACAWGEHQNVSVK